MLVIVPGKTGNGGIRTALVDGFIFGRVEHLAEVEPARLRRLPFAVVDFDPGPTISSVRVDARVGCYAAAKHLIEHGHRRFAFFPSSVVPVRRVFTPLGSAAARRRLV